jgi:hypothetical protein
LINHSTQPATLTAATLGIEADKATTTDNGAAQRGRDVPPVSDLGPSVPLPLGQALQNELERRLGVLRLPVVLQPDSVATGEKEALANILAGRTQGVPIGVQLLFDYIYSKITIKRQSKDSGDVVGSWHYSSLTYKQQQTRL